MPSDVTAFAAELSESISIGLLVLAAESQLKRCTQQIDARTPDFEIVAYHPLKNTR